MDGIVEILGALVVVVILIANAVLKQKGRTGGQQAGPPKWPGPVAQAPGAPRFPAAPSPKPPSPAPRAPLPPSLATQMSGEGIGVEGPASGERVEQELSRFSDESEQFQKQPLDSRFDRETELFEGRHLSELKSSLGVGSDAEVVTEDDGPGFSVRLGLASPASLAQAVALAEVLGKPKAFRSRRRA